MGVGKWKVEKKKGKIGGVRKAKLAKAGEGKTTNAKSSSLKNKKKPLKSRTK